MKIRISDNLIKHYLRNVYFINGHSYAGKSTMVKLLAQRYGMIACGENYHDAFPREELSRWKQPGLCYFDTMSGWQEWLSMTPEERRNPKLLNPSRKHRIARGAGVDISVVNRFIKQFEQSQKMMKQFPSLMGGKGARKGKFRLPF